MGGRVHVLGRLGVVIQLSQLDVVQTNMAPFQMDGRLFRAKVSEVHVYREGGQGGAVGWLWDLTLTV